MSLSFEVLLALGVIGFYLYDSAMLLYFNELVFSRSHGKWSSACPSGNWRIGGKFPYFPNPLTPDAPLFRVNWHSNDPSQPLDTTEDATRLTQATGLIGYFVIVLLGEMIVGLPLVIFKLGTGPVFFAVVASIYFTILLMLVITYFKRHALGLSGRDFMGLAFEAIACPPFSINLVRKITLCHKTKLNPIAFALQNFEQERFNLLAGAIIARLDEELELGDEGSTQREALSAYRSRLLELAT